LHTKILFQATNANGLQWDAAWTSCLNSEVTEVTEQIQLLRKITGAHGGKVLTPKDLNVQDNLAKNISEMIKNAAPGVQDIPENSVDDLQYRKVILYKYNLSIFNEEKWLTQLKTNSEPFFTV